MDPVAPLLSAEEALALLPDRVEGVPDVIHTFLGPYGADWDRAAIEERIRASDFRRLMRTLFGWHIAVRHDTSKTHLLIEADKAKVTAWRAAMAVRHE